MSDDAIPDDFVQLCRDRLLRQRGDAEVVVDGDRLLVAIPGQPPMSVSVHNLWRSIEAYRDTPQSLTGEVDDWARATVQPDDAAHTPEELARSLRIMVRSPEFARHLRETGLPFPVADLIPGVAVLLVSDATRTVRYLDADAIASTGLSVDEAFQQAADQQVDDFREQLEVHTGDDGVLMFTCGGTYEASLMVIGPFWDQQEEEHGPLLVAIPSRDLCLAAPRSAPDAVAALEQTVRDCFEREVPYLLVPHLYERKGGMWSLAGTVAQPTSAHTLRTVRLHTALQWVRDDEVPLLSAAPGLVTVPIRREAPHEVALDAVQDDLGAALYDRMLARRPTLQTDPDGITTLTDDGGDAVELGLYGELLEAALDDDSLVAFPTRDLVLAAPMGQVEALRARAHDAHARAGERALTTRLYRRQPSGHFQPWPTTTCGDCEAAVATTDLRCWRCGEPVYDGALLRWVGESLVVGVALFALLWALGAARLWTTALVLWFTVYIVGWVPRAALRGGRRPAVYGPWLTHLFRSFLAGATLYSLWNYPSTVQRFLDAMGDGVQAPEVTFLVMWTVLTLGLLTVWIDIGRTFGWSMMLPWTPPPTRAPTSR